MKLLNLVTSALGARAEAALSREDRAVLQRLDTDSLAHVSRKRVRGLDELHPDVERAVERVVERAKQGREPTSYEYMGHDGELLISACPRFYCGVRWSVVRRGARYPETEIVAEGCTPNSNISGLPRKEAEAVRTAISRAKRDGKGVEAAFDGGHAEAWKRSEGVYWRVVGADGCELAHGRPASCP